MFAMQVAGKNRPEMVVCFLWYWIWGSHFPKRETVVLRALMPREPAIILASPAALLAEVDEFRAWMGETGRLPR